MNTLYVLYDAEGASEAPIYGVFTSYDYAEDAANELCIKWVDEALAEPAEETGLTADDRDWLIKTCRKSLAIQMIEDIDRVFC
jgi:hypothetical protein